MRRIKDAVTPDSQSYMLESPYSAPIPLSAKKHEALLRLLPHIPAIHHRFYESLPRVRGPDDESESTDEIQRRCQLIENVCADHTARMAQDDAFLAKFDKFLPQEVQEKLKNGEN